MSTYRASTTPVGDRTIYLLHDDQSGAQASILPSYGFNLFDLRLPVAGEVLPIIVTSEGWAENPQRPGGNGTPILFPFPNRIRDGRYEFGGQVYQLPANNGPNAIHGFAYDVPWEVVEHGVDASGAFIEGRYQISQQSPAKRELWPTDAILTVRFVLSGLGLDMRIRVSNPTGQPLPFGFGIHPYFRLPFRKGDDLEKTSMILPAAETWVLDQFLPTGERRPVDARLDFRNGQSMVGLKLDDVLTGLIFNGQGDEATCTCRLIDQNRNAEFRLSFGPGFRELVAYTPRGDGDVIAIEPYTQTTDAINLQARGVDAGLQVLDHDGTTDLRIRMETTG